jgi:hypothetical protein
MALCRLRCEHVRHGGRARSLHGVDQQQSIAGLRLRVLCIKRKSARGGGRVRRARSNSQLVARSQLPHTHCQNPDSTLRRRNKVRYHRGDIIATVYRACEPYSSLLLEVRDCISCCREVTRMRKSGGVDRRSTGGAVNAAGQREQLADSIRHKCVFSSAIDVRR